MIKKTIIALSLATNAALVGSAVLLVTYALGHVHGEESAKKAEDLDVPEFVK